MRDERFDETLKSVLKDKTKNYSMSDEKRRAVLDQIHQEHKEEPTMKHVSKKKLVVAVAVMCLMASMVAVAAGKISYYQTSTYTNNPTYTSFAQIKGAKKDFGHVVRAVEEFENGVKFDRGFITEVECLDENNKKIDSYPELSLDYKLGNKNLFLSISRENLQDTQRTPVKSENVDGKMLKYYEDKYLMLPPDAKPDAEDLALEAAGELFISYGSSEVERLTSNSVVWVEGDIQYLMLSWDYSGQELINMAKTVASAELVE